jgi:cytidylate kinase
MQGDLLKYLKKRYEEPLEKKFQPGPVITITRQHGCPAKRVAQKLTEILSTKKDREGITHEWKWYSKEILDESARQLQLDPEKIKYVFEYGKKGLLEDFFSSFSNYYQSDRKIRVTIGKVIRDIAIQGHVIIIGRGGIAITHDIPNSLHISLEAPLEWRAAMVSQKYNISLEEAKETAIDIDKKRKEFRDFFQGKNNDYTFSDITINCMSFSIDEIANLISRIVEIRNLII